MPFKSEKQRKWMWANDPEMAEKWEDEEDEKNEGNMKISSAKLRKLIQEELFYREFYDEKIIKESTDRDIQFEWSRDGLAVFMMVDGQSAMKFSNQKQVEQLIKQLQDLLTGPMRTSP